MIVIGIDPGPIAGIVRLHLEYGHGPTRLLEADALQVTPRMVTTVLGALIGDDRAALAMERFIVGRRAAQSSTPGAGVVTRSLVGVVEAWAEAARVTRVTRSAADVKPWATDKRLAAAGLLDITAGMRHARDGARHVLFCAVRDFGLADPLSSKAGASVRHNHMTRDVKPVGVCPACDQYHTNRERDA